MPRRVEVVIEGPVARVQLARPEKHNALDMAMIEAIIESGEALRENRSVRAVVLHGEGKSFCTGLDFPSFIAAPDDMMRLLKREPDLANTVQRAACIWQELPVPVVAAVHGHALGGGLQIALAADMRYTTADAQWSVMEIKWGLVPDMGISQTLSSLVRADVARELTYTGRVVTGEEAVASGLATRVCANPLATALETATAIAQKSPDAIRAAKRLWNLAPKLERGAALKLESELQQNLLGTRNQFEAVAANLEKRPARFVDPTRGGDPA